MDSNTIIGLAIGVLAFYFGFKAKQAAGVHRLNNIKSDFGAGSFGLAVKSGIMQWVWAALCVVTVLVAAGFLNKTQNKQEPSTPNVQVPATSTQAAPTNVQAEAGTQPQGQPIPPIPQTTAPTNVQAEAGTQPQGQPIPPIPR